MVDPSGPAVVVLGSVHMDLIASAARLPSPGESVADGTFVMAPGGKAGNQAVQLARSGLRSHLVTRLGNDLFGRELLRAITAAGVDSTYVAIDPENATGASTVIVAAGDYASVIAPGSAAKLSRVDVDAAIDAFESMAALVVQLELPVDVTTYAAVKAKRLGKLVVLNASPAPPTPSDISQELWNSVSVLIVNRVESGRFLGTHVEHEFAVDAARALHDRYGVDTVVITLGAAGAVAVSGSRTVVQPAFPAEIVDTVGAGDAFLGVLTAGLIEEATLAESMRRAAAAGALAVGRRGAYDALPERAAVDAFLMGRADERQLD